MRSGIGFSEILLILALVVIFFNPKDLPSIFRKTVKTLNHLRGQMRKFWDDIEK